MEFSLLKYGEARSNLNQLITNFPKSQYRDEKLFNGRSSRRSPSTLIFHSQ